LPPKAAASPDELVYYRFHAVIPAQAAPGLYFHRTVASETRGQGSVFSSPLDPRFRGGDEQPGVGLMDLRFTHEELAFREEVRTFFRSALPDSIHDKMIAYKGLSKDDIVIWQRILNAKGWAVANWPGPRSSNTSSAKSCR
jgi:hypothetical protein